MIKRMKMLAAIAVLSAALPFAAEAQWYRGRNGPPPLYPYAVQGQPAYQPQGYVAQPYSSPRSFPYVRPAPDGGYFIYPAPDHRAAPPKRRHRSKQATINPEPKTKSSETKASKAKAPGPELIEDLRKQTAGAKREKTINKTTVVRGEPIIRETKKYVDDPPIVIERYHFVDDDEETPLPKPRRKRVAEDDRAAAKRGPQDQGPRVINADAEITILGPDRMTIRLWRKGKGTDANAKAE